MKAIANRIMRRRADRLVAMLRPRISTAQSIADIGSGTGHNAAAIRTQLGRQVSEFDVGDIHWWGPGPILFSDNQLPCEEGTVDMAMLLYVLQYCDKPVAMLKEAARVSKHHVLVLQTTSEPGWARRLHRLQEFLFGRFGFRLARLARLIPAQTCPLTPVHWFATSTMRDLFSQAGLAVVSVDSYSPSGWPLACDLFLLEKTLP